MSLALFEIFDPVEVSYWEGIDKEVIDESTSALFGFMRPQEMKEKIGEFDFSSVSAPAKKLLVRAMNRVGADLPLLLKRSKKYLDTERALKNDVTQMVFYLLLKDASFRNAAGTLFFNEAEDEDVANAIAEIPNLITEFRSKLTGEKK